MQLHGQNVCLFDDNTSRDGDLAGSQVLSLWDSIPSWRLQGQFPKVQTLLCPSIFLIYISNSSLPPASWHSHCSCSQGLLRKEKQEHSVLTPSLSLVAASTAELALPKEGKVRWLKAQSQISANPTKTGMKHKTQLCNTVTDQLCHQNTEHFAEKK